MTVSSMASAACGVCLLDIDAVVVVDVASGDVSADGMLTVRRSLPLVVVGPSSRDLVPMCVPNDSSSADMPPRNAIRRNLPFCHNTGLCVRMADARLEEMEKVYPGGQTYAGQGKGGLRWGRGVYRDGWWFFCLFVDE